MNDTTRRRSPQVDDSMTSLFEAMAIALGGGNPTDAIPAQEARGQRSFVNSDTLPTRRNDYGEANSQAVLEGAGVKFGEVVKGDPMFQYVELPEGWSKRGSGHSMWSDLVDEKGRKRASIFYKAAFYDRDAHYCATRRYNASADYTRMDTEGVYVGQVLDGDTVIHTTDSVNVEGVPSYERSSKAHAAAAEWLNEHYPEWENANAYWD